MPDENNKQNKPVRYEIFKDTHDIVPHPKGEFVDLFKAMQERQAAEAERKAESDRSRQQDQTSE